MISQWLAAVGGDGVRRLEGSAGWAGI